MNRIEEICQAKKKEETFLKEYILLKFSPKKDYSEIEFYKIIKKIKHIVLQIQEHGDAIQIFRYGNIKRNRKPKKLIRDILE